MLKTVGNEVVIDAEARWKGMGRKKNLGSEIPVIVSIRASRRCIDLFLIRASGRGVHL